MIEKALWIYWLRAKARCTGLQVTHAYEQPHFVRLFVSLSKKSSESWAFFLDEIK